MKVLNLSAFVLGAAGLALSANAARVHWATPAGVLTNGGIAQRGVVDGMYGFEQAEGYAPGNLNGQQGWATSPATALFNVVATNKNGSVNSVRATGDGAASGGGLRLAFSPLSTGNPLSSACFDFKMDDVLGANYFVAGQQPSTNALGWRVEFDYRGTIFVVDPSNPGAVGGFFNTGLSWVGNQWATYEVIVGATSITYRRNGVTFHVGGIVNPAYVSGEQFVLAHDNFQGLGTSVSGGPVAGYFDNLEWKVPAPGAASLLGLAGLIAGRRRR
jgi:hypothetical protein